MMNACRPEQVSRFLGKSLAFRETSFTNVGEVFRDALSHEVCRKFLNKLFIRGKLPAAPYE